MDERWVVIVVVHADDVWRPDLPLVDALCRLQLEVQRLGGTLRVRGPCEELRKLIVVVGLDDVLIVD
jgi:anti-anti-sigma regulatory factor